MELSLSVKVRFLWWVLGLAYIVDGITRVLSLGYFDTALNEKVLEEIMWTRVRMGD